MNEYEDAEPNANAVSYFYVSGEGGNPLVTKLVVGTIVHRIQEAWASSGSLVR